MPDDQSEKNGDSPVGSVVFRGRPLPPDYKGYPERRSGKDRRSGIERRERKEKKPGQDQRSGQDRRKYKRRGLHFSIPIFIKLAALSTLLTFLLIFSISMSMLRQQRKQFTAQLIDQGESMTRSIAHNARDKLLGDEDLAQVYAFIGNAGRTLDALEVAAQARTGSRSVLSMKINPAYDFIRDDPRFVALLEKVGLSDL